MNVAARVLSDNYDRGLDTILHDELLWLNVQARVEHKLGVMVYRCLHDRVPRYLADHLIAASDAAPRRVRLRSANLNRGRDDLYVHARIVSLFLAADLARTAVGLFITPARQSGTRCPMNLEILRALMAFKRFLKLFSVVTSVTSTLGVS